MLGSLLLFASMLTGWEMRIGVDYGTQTPTTKLRRCLPVERGEKPPRPVRHSLAGTRRKRVSALARRAVLGGCGHLVIRADAGEEVRVHAVYS